jgi:hypothetical protein
MPDSAQPQVDDEKAAFMTSKVLFFRIYLMGDNRTKVGLKQLSTPLLLLSLL